jgi:transcriptional regulator with XRE-family HTH domain
MKYGDEVRARRTRESLERAIGRGGFAAILARAMLDSGLCGTELATLSGDHQSNISAYLRGISIPSKRRFGEIANLIGETPESLAQKAGIVIPTKKKPGRKPGRVSDRKTTVQPFPATPAKNPSVTFRPDPVTGISQLEMSGTWRLPTNVASQVMMMILKGSEDASATAAPLALPAPDAQAHG